MSQTASATGDAAKTSMAVRQALSVARMTTYDAAASGDTSLALDLYRWNAEVSGAFMTPLHICEVATRNAVSEVLEGLYGRRWPWSRGFEQSLPRPTRGYKPLQDLRNARSGQPTLGKVIPELKFVFWQKMFTGRNDARLWIPALRRTFPNIGTTQSVQQQRLGIYGDLEQIRKLRNRIAHHEPIFSRDLAQDLAVISRLLGLRSSETELWLGQIETVTGLLPNRPC